MPLILGYWSVRGRGSAIQNLLRYVGVEYENRVYPLEPPTFSREKWLQSKYSLGLNFPNLPYLIDGQLKMTQSLAILKYLGRKYGLAATSDPETATEEMVLFQVMEISDRIRQTAHYRNFDSEEAFQRDCRQLAEDLGKQLQCLDAFLSDNRSWFTGNSLSYVDFLAYELIDWIRVLIDSNCLVKFEQITKFVTKFKNLDNLKEYLVSKEFKERAIFGPSSKLKKAK